MSHRTTSRLRLALGLSLAVAGVGCQEPAPQPAPEPAISDPEPAPAQPEPAPAQPEPAPVEPTPVEPTPVEPTPPAEATSIVITARTFPDELLDRVRLDDLVEVQLARGNGRARGHVKILRPTEIGILLSEGAITRLKPDEVKDVQVVFREERITAAAEAPRNDQEGWLDRFAARGILEGRAADLWTRRFDPNVVLPVVRPFTLTTYSSTGIKGGVATFAPSDHRTTVREGDLLKLVGVVDGLEPLPGGASRLLGEVQLYLLKRGGQVQAVYSPDRLHPSNLERAAVMRFLEREPVTLAAYRPGRDRQYVRIVRVPAKTARTYMLHLERTPERSALRAWRAQSNAGVAAAEKAVRSLYKAVGLIAAGARRGRARARGARSPRARPARRAGTRAGAARPAP